MFLNTLTANDKYLVLDCVNLSNPIQVQLSLQPTIFSDFFVSFLESISNFKLFEKKMIVIATLFRKFQTLKDLVRPLFKKHRFRNCFDNQHVKESQSPVKSAKEDIHRIFSSLWETLIWKISPLVICQILGVFCNTLTANDNFSVQDFGNLSSPIQMELYLKPTIFTDFFVSFLETISNFKHF